MTWTSCLPVREKWSWARWLWGRTCVFLQPWGCPALCLRVRRWLESVSSLTNWDSLMWLTQRSMHTHVQPVSVTQLKPYKPYEEGLIPYPTLILCVCVVSAGGHRDDKGNLRRREEENNDWHGAHKWTSSSLSGWTNVRTGCRHCQFCSGVTEEVEQQEMSVEFVCLCLDYSKPTNHMLLIYLLVSEWPIMEKPSFCPSTSLGTPSTDSLILWRCWSVVTWFTTVLLKMLWTTLPALVI